MRENFYPTSYSGTITNPENGLNSSTNTSSYATIAAGTEVYYRFDPDLPLNMILDSISCIVRCWVSSTSAPATIHLCTRLFELGQVSVTNTTSQLITMEFVKTVDLEDLNYNELSKAYLDISVGSGKRLSCYFGGADLVLTYHLPDSTIKSVKIYKKISGTWEAQEDYSGLFTEID